MPQAAGAHRVSAMRGIRSQRQTLRTGQKGDRDHVHISTVQGQGLEVLHCQARCAFWGDALTQQVLRAPVLCTSGRVRQAREHTPTHPHNATRAAAAYPNQNLESGSTGRRKSHGLARQGDVPTPRPANHAAPETKPRPPSRPAGCFARLCGRCCAENKWRTPGVLRTAK